MVSSKSLGIRIPEEILEGINQYQSEKMISSRSVAIVDLIQFALEEKLNRKMETSSQDRLSGAKAGRWGLVTSRLIAELLGGSPLSDNSNEFELDGERITIRCAKPRTTSVGLTNAMRERVAYIIAAFQSNEGHFNLYRISPEDWHEHANETTENHQNHGRVTLLSRSVCQRIGEDIGEVDIDEVE